MAFTAKDVQALREKTGVGMMECKKALVEADGDMDKAVERINRAIDNFECISIFGDFDADGVTSTALLYTYLESKGANVLWYIPDRLTGVEEILYLIVVAESAYNGKSRIRQIQYRTKWADVYSSALFILFHKI